jgi:hypothetical protein
MINRDYIAKIIYSFGSPHGGRFGTLVLNVDRSIRGYKHDNEHSWELDETNFCINFYSKKKQMTSQLYYVDQLQGWFGVIGNTPLYLYPLLDINKPGVNKTLPPIVLNGAPFNGSIFFQQALTKCGWESSNLVVKGKDMVDVYLPHNVDKVGITCPIELIPPLLDGQSLISSIDTSNIIKTIRSYKIPIITITRNIKESILDFFEAEIHKKDSKLKTIAGKKQAEEFVVMHGDGMLLHMKNALRAVINDRPKIILRYEDNIKGHIPEEIAAILNEYQPDTANILAEELPKEYDTYKKTKPVITSPVKWSEPLEEYYRAVGLASYNHILGYLD